MKKILVTIALIILTSVVLVSKVQQKDDVYAITRIMDQMEAAYNERNFKIIYNHMAEDYHNWLGNHQGRDINVKLTKQGIEHQKTMRCKRIETIGVAFIKADVAIFKARYVFTGIVDKKGGSLPSSKILGAYVLAKKNGKWRVSTFFSRSER